MYCGTAVKLFGNKFAQAIELTVILARFHHLPGILVINQHGPKGQHRCGVQEQLAKRQQPAFIPGWINRQ